MGWYQVSDFDIQQIFTKQNHLYLGTKVPTTNFRIMFTGSRCQCPQKSTTLIQYNNTSTMSGWHVLYEPVPHEVGT